MKPKRRLSASIDADLLRAVEEATRRGDAVTVSAWVADALRLKVEHDSRLRAMREFIDAYEAEHGEITATEIAQAERWARGRAITVRTTAPTKARRARQRGAG